jgi:predicted cupin superfamily sugar epimerase
MTVAEGCAMVDELTADEIRTLLRLEPHATCGSVRITYLSAQSIAAGGLPPPFSDARPMGSALYFMVTPTAPVRLHCIRNDQLYHYYLGDPLEVLLLRSDGTTDRVVVGPNLRGGEHLALHPRRYVSHCAGDGAAPMVPWRQHRVAGRGARRRGDRQCRGTGGEVSIDCR